MNPMMSRMTPSVIKQASWADFVEAFLPGKARPKAWTAKRSSSAGASPAGQAPNVLPAPGT